MKVVGKIPYIVLAALVVMAAAPAAAMPIYAVDHGHGPGHGGPGHGGHGFFRNITYDQLVTVFYNVRNETMPLLEWAIANNVTVAEKFIAKAEFLFNKSLYYNSTGDTFRAKILVLLAARVYAHSPVVARIVLGKTIRGNLVNGTIANTTVLAVLEKAGELRTLLSDAISYAATHNVALPSFLATIIGRADTYLNMSREALQNGTVYVALRLAVKGYMLYTKAYRIVAYATIISGILPSQPPAPPAPSAAPTHPQPVRTPIKTHRPPFEKIKHH